MGCSRTPMLLYRIRLQELPMLQTQPLAIAGCSRHQGWGTTMGTTTQPRSRALQPGEGRGAGRFAPAPSPEEGAGRSISVSPAGRTSLRTDPPPGQDKMEVPKCVHTYTHTDVHRGGRAGERHLLELLSLSLVFDVTPSAKQPERPLQKERGQRAQGHPGCHQALLTQGRATPASRKTRAPAPAGTSLRHTGRAAALALCWETGDVQGDARLLREKAGMPGGGCLAGMGRRWASQAEGGKVECRARGCSMHTGGKGGHCSTPAWGQRSLPLGRGLGLTETRQ